MNLVARRPYRSMQLFLVVALFLVLPFIGMTQRVVASDEHAAHTSLAADCATICINTTPSTPPQAVLATENKTQDPSPSPQLFPPYHHQFQNIPAPQKLPSTAYAAWLARPPDLIKFSGHFLF